MANTIAATPASPSSSSSAVSASSASAVSASSVSAAPVQPVPTSLVPTSTERDERLRARLSAQEKPEFVLAAIDIGTNSVHMVVARIDATLPAFNIVGKEKETVRLGDFCEETGDLTEAAMTRCIAALKRCMQIAESLQVDDVVAVATSAVREAGNGQLFIDRVKAAVGLSVNLISGTEEARRIYLGVISGVELKGKPHVIIDIGGGSTEIIAGRGGVHDFLSSSKVGAVRLTARFINSDPVDKKEFEYLRAYVHGVLEPTVDGLKSKLARKLEGQLEDQLEDQLEGQMQKNQPLRMIGTSGTIECLATLIAADKTGAEPDPLNGYKIDYDELSDWVTRLRKMTCEERLALAGMSDRRAEIIVAGAVILQVAMDLLKVRSLKICERALREGVVVDWMLTHGLIEDRMAFQESIRDRSVRKLSRKYKANGEAVAAFAVSLFDQTRNEVHSLGLLEREYLWAAAMLHNSGHYVSNSAHHKHSYYLIRNGGLLGFTETEVEIIGNIARYHRKSYPKRRHENYNNLPGKHERKLVDQLSAILRLAVALDRARSQAITAVQAVFDSKAQALHLYLTPSDVDNGCELELWNLAYKKEWFETVFEVSVEAAIAQ
ncbi:MAG: Ppx/GppA phosphatase family protein [Phormidesmis sp.]